MKSHYIFTFFRVVVCLLTVLNVHPDAARAGYLSLAGGGCSVDSVLVTQPQCAGDCTGSITLFAQGNGPLSYQWSGWPGVDTSSVSGLCAGWYTVVITDSAGCVLHDTIEVDEPPGINYEMVTIDATCPGGCSGSVTVTGLDSVPHTFQWLGYVPTGPYLGSLCQGTYAVVITNSQGCSVIASAEVGYDPPFGLSFVTTSASCVNSCDGSATVFANGIPPFSYQWSTGPIQNTQGALNLCTGTYMVNVTDSTGCVVTDSVWIPLASPPVLSFTQSPPVCFGGCNGTAEVMVTGSGQYQYEWNTFPIQDSAVATGLCAGTYTVQVTDIVTGCVYTGSVTVQNPDPPSLTFGTTPSFCDNFCSGSATVTASGTGPFSYLWQTGSVSQTALPLCPGIYSVTVTDSLGCATSASVSVPSQELLFNVTGAYCDSVCDATIEILLPGGMSWQVTWYTNPVQHTSLITNVCPGNYSVTILDTAGCQVTAMAAVNAQQPIGFSATVVPVSCPGACDGAVLSTLNGNAPFVIDWTTLPGTGTDSVFQLCPGLYPVLITDSLGCTLADTILVSEPVAPTFTMEAVPNSCYGICDAASIINPVIAGTYTYTWQTLPFQYGSTANDLCEGWTTVAITDTAGCVTLDSILILGPAAIDISFSATSPSCPGDCDGFAASQIFGGTPGYSYFWSNGFLVPQIMNLCEGTYTLTVIDSEGCLQSDSVVLDDPQPLSLTLTVTDASCATCADGSVAAAVSGGSAPYHYLWIPGGVGGPALNNLLPGDYMLCVSDDHSCITCDSVQVSFANMLAEVPGDDHMLYFTPNPCDEFTMVAMHGEPGRMTSDYSVTGYDVLGRMIVGLKYDEVRYRDGRWYVRLDTATLRDGMYIITVTDGNSGYYAGKIRVQH